MQVDTALLGLSPMFWHTLIDIGLVYYLRYKLWQVVDQGGVRGGDLGAVDGICRAVFYEKCEKSENAVDEENDDEGVDQEEDGKTTTHVAVIRSRRANQGTDSKQHEQRLRISSFAAEKLPGGGDLAAQCGRVASNV